MSVCNKLICAKEVISRLKQYIEGHSDVLNDPSRWIEGMGWDQTKWPGAQFPTAVRILAMTLDIYALII